MLVHRRNDAHSILEDEEAGLGLELTAADDIMEQVRALPERERLRLVERIVHEVVEQKLAAPAQAAGSGWADVSDDEFDAFMKGIRTSRAEPWRTIE
jgi:hypothetical protein